MLYSKRSARIILLAIGAGVFASPGLLSWIGPCMGVYELSDGYPISVLAEREETRESRQVEQEEVGTLRSWWAGEMTVLEAPPEVPLGPATDLDEHVEVRRVLERRVAPGR